MYTKMTPGWELGKWLVICQVCGWKKPSDQIKRRWDGVLVCEEDFETRHPQEFVRPRPDEQKVPFTNPEPTDTFVDVTFDQTGAHHDIPSGTNDNSL